MSQHIVLPKTYLTILLALLAFTAITVWVAFVDLAYPWNNIVAVAIAVTKATLVVLFFMHVKYGTRMTKLTVAAALIWLFFLLFITVSDPVTRDWITRLPG